jgi:hypothetical protein
MTKCTSANSIYGDICFSPGKKSLPGVRGYVYGIAKRDIMTWPTIGAEAPKTLADVAKYAGDFVLATDKKWHKIGLIPNESELQAESQGSFGSKTFKVTGTAVIPGTEEEVSGYIAQANNDEMVYLFIQRNGKARMVGSEAFTPELSLSQGTGKATTDANSTTISAVADDEYPAPFYPGKIETEDGDISGATGLPIVVADNPHQ